MSDDQRIGHSREPFLAQLSAVQFQIAVGVAGCLVVLLLVRLRFCYVPAVPPKPEKPATTDPATTRITIKSSKGDKNIYLGHLKTDAANAGVAVPTLAQMGAKFKYTFARPNAQLSPTGRNFIESAGVRLEVTRRKLNGVWILVLAIENPSTENYLAYRVHTRLIQRGAEVRGATAFCAGRQRALIAHNALAMRPSQTITRTECIYQRGLGLEILEVETMVIPPVSYFYVSKLVPTRIGVEARETANHALPAGAGRKFCRLLASNSIVRQIERKQITWRQLIDYFARHDCARYRQFPEGYKAFKRDEEHPLPILP